MNKSDIIRKLTSRKLWLSLASFISMLMVYLGYAESEGEKVAALVIAGATVLGYVLGEGLTDAANAPGTGEDTVKDTDTETK